MKTELTDIKCLSLDDDGEGLFNVTAPKGMTVSRGKVPGVLPGETARVSALPTLPHEGETPRYRLEAILKASRDRIPSACPLFPSCGGCALIEARLEARRDFLRAKVKSALASAGITLSPGKEIWDARESGYRNKMTLSLGIKDRVTVMGFYQAGTRRIVPLQDGCLAQTQTENAIARAVVKLMATLHVPAFDDKTGRGLIRYVEIREAVGTGEVLVTLVSASRIVPGAKDLARRLVSLYPQVKSVVLNVNARRTPVVLGDEEITLYGPSFIHERLGSVSYRISSKTFFQVNGLMAQALYQELSRLSSLSEKDVVYDCYSGVGTIGLALAHRAREVIGIELNPDSVRLANASAKENGFANARFHQGDATLYLKNAAAQGRHADLIVLDPPRSGSTPEFLSALLIIRPSKILYVSCGPESLGRDLKVLLKGYEVKEIVLVDMFPGTAHVECVVLMSRVEK